MDVIGTAIILGLCFGFGLAALGFAIAGIFIKASRAVAQWVFEILHLSSAAIFPLLMRALRPLLLTASALCVMAFLFIGMTFRQVYLLDQPLVGAAGHGDLAKVRTLLNKGASPDSYGFDSSTTALVEAARYGHREVVVLLLCSGASPALRDADGNLPSELAAENGHEDIARLIQDRSTWSCN